jgi:hypothetical protein
MNHLKGLEKFQNVKQPLEQQEVGLDGSTLELQYGLLEPKETLRTTSDPEAAARNTLAEAVTLSYPTSWSEA